MSTNATLDTLETHLERARQAQTPVSLVLGGRFEAPIQAMVRARNGTTFELVIDGAVLVMEHSSVVLRTA